MTTVSSASARSLSVSVVVPTYNRRERLHKVLASLAAQDIDGRVEVVVVSDGSTDGTDEYLASADVPVPVTAVSQPNGGPAAARNRGVEVATGDLVVFVDDDVVACPSLLRLHRDAHALRTDLVSIGPMLDPADHPMSAWVRWEQRMLGKQYKAMADGVYSATAKQFYTGNAAIRRADVIDAGGFDASFRRAEDIELAYRLADRGLEFAFLPDAIGYHYAERSLASWRETAYVYGRNDIVFARDRNQGWIYGFIAEKFGEHRAPIRWLVSSALPWPRIGAVLVRAGCSIALAADRVHADSLSRLALSAAYAVEYHRGVADELGGVAQFRRLVTAGA